MKDLTRLLLVLSAFLVVSSMVGYEEAYPDVEHFIGIIAILLMSACLSLMAIAIEISKESK
jgi:hypothetical protein